ncbi:MAG: DUF302 domain-containing protein [Acidobacteriaceae bacterium]
MASDSGNGVARRQSRDSVDETVERLTALLAAKGVTLFALVDHSGEAAKAGMTMPNTKLLIFGSPRAGTPVMLAAPGIALDLPLKILVREDGDGSVWLEWNRPDYLAERHGVPADLMKNISAAEGLASEAGG